MQYFSKNTPVFIGVLQSFPGFDTFLIANTLCKCRTYASQAVVIIRLCQVMFPAPGIHFHIGRTILAIPDLISPLLKPDLLCN